MSIRVALVFVYINIRHALIVVRSVLFLTTLDFLMRW